MSLFDRFCSSETKQDLDEQFINGEISHAEYERKLDRQIEAIVTKEEKLQEKRESRQLAGSTPQTYIDSGGTGSNYSAQEQELDRDDLRKLKRLREDGGIISQLVHARALLTFGTGCEFESEDDEVAEWLNDQFDNLDDLLIRLGEDSYWFARGFGETIETNGGDFGRIVGVEPWTMEPQVDRHGQVQAWEQEIQDRTTQTFDPEEIGVIILEKSSARDETGISIVLRAYDEIKAFKENQQSINRAIELAGFPHIHWKVGAENQMAVNDQELRRVRNIVQSMESDTQLVTGTDVEHDRIDPTTFDFTEISQHDIRRVATALGVPLELASVISEGLGSGEQSGLRQRMFKMQVRADRRTMSDQFIEQFVFPILEEYSPFNPENVDRLSIKFDPLFEDKDEKKGEIDAIGDDLTVNERRALFDREPIGDDVEEVDGESFVPGKEQEEPESGEPDVGGLFASGITAKSLQEADEEFSADTFKIVAEGDGHDYQSDLLGIGVDFPNAGVYVDWNIDAWPDDQQLRGPHVSDYDTLEDLEQVTEGRIEPIQTVEAARLSDGDSGNCNCGSRELAARDRHEEHEEWELALMDLESKVYDVSTDRQLFSMSETATPEFVKERIEDAIMGGVVFSQFETLDNDAIMDFRLKLVEDLQSDRWTIDGVADRIMELPGVENRQQAERIARTETGNVLREARKSGYEEKGQLDSQFYWSGNLDDRETPMCAWLIAGDSAAQQAASREGESWPSTGFEGTNPFEGGNPVPMDELEDLIERAADLDPTYELDARRLTPHINCRKSFVRMPGT